MAKHTLNDEDINAIFETKNFWNENDDKLQQVVLIIIEISLVLLQILIPKKSRLAKELLKMQTKVIKMRAMSKFLATRIPVARRNDNHLQMRICYQRMRYMKKRKEKKKRQIKMTEDKEDESSASNYLYGKVNMKWSKIPPKSSKTTRENIVTVLPGLKGPACLNPPKTNLDAWKLLINSDTTNGCQYFEN